MSEEQQAASIPRTYNGIGQLCFLPNDDDKPSVFYGHFIDPVSKTSLFGLSGKEVECEVILDCCCQADDPPIFHKVVVVSYSEKKEIALIAERKGGDYVKLNGKHIEFTTKSIKINDEAKEHTRRFLNPKLSYIDGIIVCIGEMVIKDIDFQNPPLIDSDMVCSHHSTTTTNQKIPKTTTEHETHKPHNHSHSYSIHGNKIHDKKDDFQKRSKRDEADDFGFEEDENVIKIGDTEEEVLWTKSKRSKREIDSDNGSDAEDNDE
eukprot:TRINITY_DN2897_c0_g1_i1.p1 TRINITY_DN2897_c0_g1~~TRINITY_DN2897_c0_g1_i1.p1  ORF type:complete len:263 (-),score=63.80 TRINITY_DN2897_c0_g1_i1:46-834(-)